MAQLKISKYWNRNRPVPAKPAEFHGERYWITFFFDKRYWITWFKGDGNWFCYCYIAVIHCRNTRERKRKKLNFLYCAAFCPINQYCFVVGSSNRFGTETELMIIRTITNPLRHTTFARNFVQFFFFLFSQELDPFPTSPRTKSWTPHHKSTNCSSSFVSDWILNYFKIKYHKFSTQKRNQSMPQTVLVQVKFRHIGKTSLHLVINLSSSALKPLKQSSITNNNWLKIQKKYIKIYIEI